MTASAWLGILVLPAVSFALLYFPVLTRLSPSLASHYPKAEIKRRLLAGSVDGSLFAMSLYFYVNSGSAWFVVGGAAYVVFRDALMGRSVGKFSAGLTVISLETGLPCTLAGAVQRNVMFLFPGANIAAVFLEATTVVRDPNGHRLGDRLARTQVVRGLGARDLAKAFARWWSKPSVVVRGGRLGPAPGVYGPGRAPGIPRFRSSGKRLRTAILRVHPAQPSAEGGAAKRVEAEDHEGWKAGHDEPGFHHPRPRRRDVIQSQEV